jgi:hypothetical protein
MSMRIGNGGLSAMVGYNDRAFWQKRRFDGFTHSVGMVNPTAGKPAG